MEATPTTLPTAARIANFFAASVRGVARGNVIGKWFETDSTRVEINNIPID